MLVFNDGINKDPNDSGNSNRFWIKNTISNVKINKLKSKNDTNLAKKINIKQIECENISLKIRKNKKNLNKNSYNNIIMNQYNGKKQTKETKKIRKFNK